MHIIIWEREPRLPVDMAFGLERESVQEKSYTEYVSDLREKISDAFEKVQKNADLSREKQKRNYDLRAKAASERQSVSKSSST